MTKAELKKKIRKHKEDIVIYGGLASVIIVSSAIGFRAGKKHTIKAANKYCHIDEYLNALYGNDCLSIYKFIGRDRAAYDNLAETMKKIFPDQNLKNQFVNEVFVFTGKKEKY